MTVPSARKFFRSIPIPVITALTLLVLQSSGANAGMITFNDLADGLTFTENTGGRVTGSCIGEVCTLTLLQPQPAVAGVGLNFSANVNIFGAPGTPEAGQLSDTFQFICCSNPFPTMTLIFSSDSENGPPLTLLPGAFTISETGAVQLAGTISYFNANGIFATDTINFVSDVEATPEPAGLALGLIGFGFIALRMRIRRRHSAALTT